jgi:hypothetical protein
MYVLFESLFAQSVWALTNLQDKASGNTSNYSFFKTLLSSGTDEVNHGRNGCDGDLELVLEFKIVLGVELSHSKIILHHENA